MNYYLIHYSNEKAFQKLISYEFKIWHSVVTNVAHRLTVNPRHTPQDSQAVVRKQVFFVFK